MNNQIQGPQMNANSINMNDSADKENMQPSVPPATYGLPLPQQQQPQMVPQTCPMPSSQAYLDEQKRIDNMVTDVQKPSACQAQQMMTNPYGYPLPPMNNQAVAPGIANTSGSDIAAENTPDEDANLPDWKIQFAEVAGRLSLRETRKYKITRSEINRRLEKPEHLNLTSLIDYVRVARNVKGTENVKKKLTNVEINVEEDRWKGVQNTVFTTLTEEEAKQVVTDFRNITDKHFYEKYLVFESLARTTSLQDLSIKAKRTQCTQMAMQDIFRVLDKAVSPVCDDSTDVKSTLHPKTQEAFDNFSKVTHGFGLPALRVSWDAYNKTLGECAKAYANPMAFCYELHQLHL